MKVLNKFILFFLATTLFSPSLCQENSFESFNAEHITDEVDCNENFQVKSLTELCVRKIIEITHDKISNEENPIAALQLLHVSLPSTPDKSKTVQMFSCLLKKSNLLDSINHLGEVLTIQEREEIILNFSSNPVDIGRKFFSESIPFVTTLLTKQKLPPLTNSRLDQIKALGGLAILIHKTTKNNIQALREALSPTIDMALEENNSHCLQLMIDNNLFCYCNLHSILQRYFITGNEEFFKTIEQLNFSPITNPYINNFKWKVLSNLEKCKKETPSKTLEKLKKTDISIIKNPYLKNYVKNICKSENLELLSPEYIQANLPDLYEPCDELRCNRHPEEFIETLLVELHNDFIEEQEKLYGVNYTINQNILDAYQKHHEKIRKILIYLLHDKKILDPFLDNALQQDQKEKSFFAQHFEKKMNIKRNNILRINPFLQRDIALFLRILREQNKYNPTKEDVVKNAWKNRSWRYILRDAYPDYFTSEVISRPRENVFDTNGDMSLLNFPEEEVKLFYKEADSCMWSLTDDVDVRFLSQHYFNLDFSLTIYSQNYPFKGLMDQ